MHEQTNEKETRPRTSNPRLRSNRIPSNPVVFRRNPGYGFPSDLHCRKNPWDPTDGLRRFPSAGNYRILLLHSTESASRMKKFRFLVRIRISFGFLQESKSIQIMVLSSWGRFPFDFPRFKIQNLTNFISGEIHFRFLGDSKSKINPHRYESG
jgi:hypothetical protein